MWRPPAYYHDSFCTGLALLASVALGSAGCTLGDDGGDPGPGLGTNEPLITPPIVHTGFDGTNAFKVPINTDLVRYEDGQLSWEVDDDTILSITSVNAPPFPGSFGEEWAMLETKKAGTTKVHAVIGDKRLTAEVIVTEYDPAKRAAGDTRYNDDAGMNARIACASCHLVAGGADHTPTEIGFHDDAAILQATVMGSYPDVCRDQAKVPCECGSSGCTEVAGHVLNDGNHSWELTQEEQEGIIPYLRSLPPNGFTE